MAIFYWHFFLIVLKTEHWSLRLGQAIIIDSSPNSDKQIDLVNCHSEFAVNVLFIYKS